MPRPKPFCGKPRTPSRRRLRCPGKLAGQKKYAEAEPLLLSGYDGMNQQHPAASTTSRFTPDQAGEAVVTLYQDWGKRDKVAEWKTNSKRQKPPQTGNVRELA